MIGSLDAKIPDGPIEEKWDQHKFDMKLVNPANKRRFEIIVVGTGLAGASAAATLGELGYHVTLFTFHDSPRRAHSIAAQGGINAAKNYHERRRQRLPPLLRHGEGRRLPRPRGERVPARAGEREHHRPVRRAGRAVRPRVRRPARQPLVRRRAGVAHVLRARPDRPAAAARRLPGARCARSRLGNVDAARPHRDARPRGEGRPRRRHRHPRPHHRRGPVALPRTRSCSPPAATATSSILSTNAKASNVTAVWRAHKRGALFANPCYTQIHPTCIPRERRLPVEAHADVGVAAQRRPHLGAEADRRPALARPDPRGRARLLPRAPLPRVRQPRAARRRVARGEARGRRRPRRRAAEERRVPRLRRRDPAARPRRHRGALRQPLRDVRAHHRRGPVQGADAHLPRGPLHDGRALGRLQPDEQRPRPVRARRGELLRPRRQPARRERAHAGPRRRLLRAPGHDRRLPRAAARRAARRRPTTPRSARPRATSHDQARRLLSINGTRSVDHFHRELGNDHVGQLRHGPQPREPREGARRDPRAARGVLGRRAACSASDETLNQSLEKAGRVADFLEFGELLCRDALHREESCGGHFRVEHQTEDGEALRDDDDFAYVAAWEFTGRRTRHRSSTRKQLEFEYVHLAQRSYKWRTGELEHAWI